VPFPDSWYESPVGWLVPGYWGWRWAEGDRSRRERWWPYLVFGLLGGWIYNSRRAQNSEDAEFTYVPRPFHGDNPATDEPWVIVRPQRRRN
jgi:hypothetical protein